MVSPRRLELALASTLPLTVTALAVTALAAMTFAACQSAPHGAAGASAGSVSAAAPGVTVTERAETGPITAIAARGSELYAGTSRGLRRWDVASDEYETLGAEVGLPGHGVTALAFDGGGEIWVAGDAGVGRLVRSKGESAKESYQSFGGLAGITALAPTEDGRGAWAGGSDGLFRSDGKSWTPIGELRGVTVTSLELDRDGRAAWAGTRALGLFRVDGDHAREVPLGEDAAGLEVVGTAVTTVGTRVVGARDARSEAAHLVFLEEGEPQAFRAQPEVRMVRVVDTGKDAVLVAGAAGAERAYSLQLLRAGEPPPPGGLRFVSVKKGTPSARARDRWAAVPLDEVPPPGVTVAAGSDGALYYGTERRGVARGAKHAPAFLSGAELVGDAERLTVACAARERCFVVTDGPRPWVTDGDVYRATRAGEADDGAVLAVVSDRAGTIYALSTEPKFTGLVISRLAEAVVVGAAQAAVGDTWKTFERVPLKMPVEGPPGVSFASVSPTGTLWVGVRAHVASAEGEPQDVSAGAVEIDLASHHATQHRALKEGEQPSPDMLPLPAALTGVFFDDGAVWFSSLSGVSRWQQGDLRTWGENEGLASELVHAVGKAPGDAIWAATSEGVARLDGKIWRALSGAEEAIVACRGLARDATDAMWIATAKGLRRVPAADAKAGGRIGDVVVTGDEKDVRMDRFGRLWVLSNASIALVDLSRH
jgi:hypothetical protein